MGLSEESRTLLQLLLGRGKSYNDIAGLLGITEDEARGRAHQALTEINGSDPDTEANLTDYLLGQADPISRADVARTISENESAAETASSLSDQLRLLVPGADLPRPGTAGSISAGRPRRSKPAKKAGSAAPAAATPAATAKGDSSPHRNRLIAILVMGAALVAVIVLVATGAFSGDDNDSSEAQATGGGQFAGATMQPVGNQSGSGRVQLGRVEDNFAANLQFSDLTPTTKSNSYVLWMDGSLGAFPLTEFAVDKTGTFSNTVVLPPEALCSISAGIFTDLSVSKVTKAEAKTVIADTQKALQSNKGKLPDLAGKTAYTGPVAIPQELKTLIDEQCQTAQTTGNQ